MKTPALSGHPGDYAVALSVTNPRAPRCGFSTAIADALTHGPTENRLDEPEGCCEECGRETDGASLCYDCGRDRYAAERYDEYER